MEPNLVTLIITFLETLKTQNQLELERQKKLTEVSFL